MPHRLKIWLLALTVAVLLPAIAVAHAILEESTPPVGAVLDSGKIALRFRYNSRIDRVRSRLILTRPDHTKETVPIVSEGPPDIISAVLDLPPGAYVIRWQVLAADGHITRGDVPFTVAAH